MSTSKYSEQIKLPKDKNNYNTGLTTPSAAFMEKLLGKPRLDSDFKYTTIYGKSGPNKGKVIKYEAKPTFLQNKALEKLMKRFKVDSIHGEGLEVAVNSLRTVITEVLNEYPDLKGRITSGGMCVPRFISTRKSKKNPIPKIPSKLSNHSWGCAIDLKIDGVADVQDDNVVLRGLELIAPIFNKHGWVWGGAYITAAEDGMHFEVSKETLLKWKQGGLLFCNNDLSARIVEGQKTISTNNPLTPKQPAPNNHFKSWYQQTPEDTHPNWYGTNGWVTKVRSKLGWFR